MTTPTGRQVNTSPVLQNFPLATPEADRLREAFRQEFSPYGVANHTQATPPQTSSESSGLAPIQAQ